MTGLSGLGDLILTCSSPQSRNFSLGMALGKGQTPAAGEQGGGKARRRRIHRTGAGRTGGEKGIEMPIASAVADILDGRASVDEAIENLLTRPFRAEG